MGNVTKCQSQVLPRKRVQGGGVITSPGAAKNKGASVSRLFELEGGEMRLPSEGIVHHSRLLLRGEGTCLKVEVNEYGDSEIFEECHKVNYFVISGTWKMEAPRLEQLFFEAFMSDATLGKPNGIVKCTWNEQWSFKSSGPWSSPPSVDDQTGVWAREVFAASMIETIDLDKAEQKGTLGLPFWMKRMGSFEDLLRERGYPIPRDSDYLVPFGSKEYKCTRRLEQLFFKGFMDDANLGIQIPRFNCLMHLMDDSRPI